MRDVSILTIAFSIFFAVATVARRHKSTADYYLLALLVLLTVMPGAILLLASDDPASSLRVSYLSQGALLAFAPLFLFYSLALTDSNFRPGFREWPQTLPFVLYLALFSIPTTHRALFVEHYTTVSFVASSVFVLYVASSLAIVVRRRRDTSPARVTWLLGIDIGLLSVWVISMVQDVVFLSRGAVTFDDGYQDLTPVLVLVLLVALGVLGTRSGALASVVRGPTRSRARLDRSQLLERVRSAIGEDELFLNPELTLVDVAVYLDSTPSAVSEAISQSDADGFRDFVNAYRVARFQRLVAEGESRRFTIEAVAFASGFNSRSSFYRVFHRTAGMTPREYMATQTE